MFRLLNKTPWHAQRYAGWGRSGEYQFTIVIKASFAFSLAGDVTALTPANPIQQIDRYHDSEHLQTLSAACEIVPFKAGSELLLSGHAYSSHVAVSVGNWCKSIAVIPAHRRLMRWVLASDSISALSLQHFAPIANHIAPRQALFASAVSRTTLSPHGTAPPANLYNYAPRDQQFSDTFIGDEPVCLSGFFIEQPTVTWRLPRVSLQVQQGERHYPAVCDTLQIDTDAKVFDLIFRAAIPAQLFHQKEFLDVAIHQSEVAS